MLRWLPNVWHVGYLHGLSTFMKPRKVGDVASHGIYGKWEDYTLKRLPLLDACGAHIGPTPDSASPIYHYHVQDQAPFTVGCHGPSQNGGLVSVALCRSLYQDCDNDGGSGTSITTKTGILKYDRFCPCFDATGSNMGINIQELPSLSSSEIYYSSESTTTTTTTTTTSTTTTTGTTGANGASSTSASTAASSTSAGTTGQSSTSITSDAGSDSSSTSTTTSTTSDGTSNSLTSTSSLTFLGSNPLDTLDNIITKSEATSTSSWTFASIFSMLVLWGLGGPGNFALWWHHIPSILQWNCFDGSQQVVPEILPADCWRLYMFWESSTIFSKQLVSVWVSVKTLTLMGKLYRNQDVQNGDIGLPRLLSMYFFKPGISKR